MTPTNTTKQVQENPLLGLAISMGSGIEQQESQGQRELIMSDVLPSEGDWDSLEAFGGKKGKQVEGDPLFTRCQLPQGWQKRATDHSMWSELIDSGGEVKGSIFYKAAFYDRSAHWHLKD